MSTRHEQLPLSEEEQRRRAAIAKRLAEEAYKNTLRPEISVELTHNVPGALGDEHAARWLAHQTGEIDARAIRIQDDRQ